MGPVREAWRSYERLGPEGDASILARYYRGDPVSDDEKARIRGRAHHQMIRHAATRVWGRDLALGFDVPPPDRHWARGAFRSPWEAVRGAAGLPPDSGQAAQQRKAFPLPEAPALRRRKLARLAVLGGG